MPSFWSLQPVLIDKDVKEGPVAVRNDDPVANCRPPGYDDLGDIDLDDASNLASCMNYCIRIMSRMSSPSSGSPTPKSSFSGHSSLPTLIHPGCLG